MTRQPSPVAMLQPGPLEERYRREGYVDFHTEIDAQCCAECSCEGCGAPKTRYVGLFKPKGSGDLVTTLFGTCEGTYRALSHCDVCGLEAEF